MTKTTEKKSWLGLGVAGLALIAIVALLWIYKPWASASLSFEGAYSQFVDSMTARAVEYSNQIKSFKNVKEKVSFELEGGTKLANGKINATIDSVSSVDMKKSASDMNIDFDANLPENQKVKGKGLLSFLLVDSALYGQVKELTVDLGSGNAQWDFVNSIAKGLLNKWIHFDDASSAALPQQEFKTITSLPATLSDLLKKHKIFTLKDTKKEGKTIKYFVDLDKKNLENLFIELNSTLSVQTASGAVQENNEIIAMIEDFSQKVAFQGYFEVSNTDTVQLVLSDVKINADQVLSLSGYIGGNEGSLTLASEQSQVLLDRATKFTSRAMNIKLISNEKTDPEMNIMLNITPSGALGASFDGSINYEAPAQQWAEEEKVEFRFSGKTNASDEATFSAETPKDAVKISNLMQGLMGGSEMPTNTEAVPPIGK